MIDAKDVELELQQARLARIERAATRGERDSEKQGAAQHHP